MLSKIDEKREQIKHEIRPLDPVQPSEPHACLWVQGRDQEVLGGDAGCAVGAVGAAGAEDAVDAEGAEDAEVEDAAWDHHPRWLTLEGPWESVGHRQQTSWHEEVEPAERRCWAETKSEMKRWQLLSIQ